MGIKKKLGLFALLGMFAVLIGVFSAGVMPVKAADSSFYIEDGTLRNYFGNETSVVVPNNVTVIGANAFQNRTQFTDIVLPSGLKRIESGAFQGCTGLQSITIPESVEYLGDNVFNGCSNLVTVILSSKITGIGDSAFLNCTSLKNINIPKNITVIGMNAFRNCSALEKFTIPAGIKEIYPDSLRGTKYYDNYSGDFLIANGILLGYFGKSSVATIPDTVKKIGYNVFYESNNITDIIFPGSVTSLDNVFAYCKSLSNIVIPANVTEIGDNFLFECSGDELSIYSTEDTAAEKYADDNNIDFNEIFISEETATIYSGGTVSTLQLRAYGPELQPFQWSSSNKKVATVSATGLVTAKTKGKAIITAKLGGVVVSCTVTVDTPHISSKTLTLKAGSTSTLSVKGITKGVTWKSSNSSIVKVSSTGKVTAVKAGTATVTATVKGVKYQCVVTVKKK